MLNDSSHVRVLAIAIVGVPISASSLGSIGCCEDACDVTRGVVVHPDQLQETCQRPEGVCVRMRQGGKVRSLFNKPVCKEKEVASETNMQRATDKEKYSAVKQ